MTGKGGKGSNQYQQRGSPQTLPPREDMDFSPEQVLAAFDPEVKNLTGFGFTAEDALVLRDAGIVYHTQGDPPDDAPTLTNEQLQALITQSDHAEYAGEVVVGVDLHEILLVRDAGIPIRDTGVWCSWGWGDFPQPTQKLVAAGATLPEVVEWMACFNISHVHHPRTTDMVDRILHDRRKGLSHQEAIDAFYDQDHY